MTSNHNDFEFLCALAAADQLSGPERVELHQHSLQCSSCRNRMQEMAKANRYIALSHVFNDRTGALPKGMRERFIVRAIKEGVPLRSPSKIGLDNLGLASALFIILLATAAAIRTGPFSRPVADTSHFDAARLGSSAPMISPTPPSSPVSLLPRRREHRGAGPRGVQVRWRLAPSGALPGRLNIAQNRNFLAVLSSPHSMLAAMPSDAGRLSSWPYMPSRFKLAVPPALIRESALRLLADSEHSAADPIALPSQFTFAAPRPLGFHSALDMDAKRTHPDFEFVDAPLKFHFVEYVTQ
jgi:hypothetical protein